MTLGQSWMFDDLLANTSQLEWLGTLISSLPSLLLELGIEQMVNQNGS